MKKSLHIAVAFDQPALLEQIVQQLAANRYLHLHGIKLKTQGLEEVITSSTETFTPGSVSLSEEGLQPVNYSFITRFLFTCYKCEAEDYKLSWSIGLS